METPAYSDIFGIEPNNKQASANTLLVANPLLDEVWFSRSVVYLTTYNNEEVMGFVQNKPFPFTLDKVVDAFKDFKNIPVYCGGPVEGDRLFYIHTLGSLITDSIYVGNGISVGGDIISVLSYLSAGNKIDGYIKFFLGYSGWNVEQLKMELKTQSWGVTEMLHDEILYKRTDDDLWRKYVKELGAGYSNWLRIPPSPIFN